MDSHKARIKALEQRQSAGDAGLLAVLLRRSNAEGATMSGAIESMESERGRSIDPSFRERAIRTAAAVRAMVAALFAVAP